MRNRLDPASAVAAATTGRRLERSYVAPKKIKSAYDIVAQSYGERQSKQSKAAVLNGLLPDSISLAKHNNKNISNTSNIQSFRYLLPQHEKEFSKNTDDSHLYSTADGSNNTHNMMSMHTGNSHKDGCNWNSQAWDDKENQNWMSNQIDEDQRGIRQDDIKKSSKMMFKSIEGLSSNWNPQQSELQMHEGTSKGSNVAVEASSKSSRASTFRSIQQQQQQYQLELQNSRQEFIEQEAAIAAETSNNNQYLRQNEEVVVYQQRGYPIKKNDYLIMEEQRNHTNNISMSSTSGMPSKPNNNNNNNTEQHSFQRDRRRHSFEAQPRIERSKTGDPKGSSSLRQLSAQVSQRLSQSLHQNAALFVKSSTVSAGGGVSREVGVVNSFNNGMQGSSQRYYQNRSNTISNSFRQNESMTADSYRTQGVLNRNNNQANSKSTSRIQQQQQQHNINKKKQQVQLHQQSELFERENQMSSNSNDADKESIQRLRETVHCLQIRDASHRLEASKLKKTIVGLRQDLELSKGETAAARAQADTDAEYIRQLDGQLSVYVEKLETLQKALDRQIRDSSEETRALMSENEELRKQIDDLERIRGESQRQKQQGPEEGGDYRQAQGVMALANDGEDDEVDGDSSSPSNYEHQGEDADDDDYEEENGEECDCEECNNNNHCNNDAESYSEMQQQQYAAVLPSSSLSSYQLKDPKDCSYLPFSHEIITEHPEEDEQSSRVNIHSSSHLSQAQSTAKMININLQALWNNNSSRAGNNNNTGYQNNPRDLNSNNHNNLGENPSAFLSSSMVVNSKKGAQTSTGRSISQQQLFMQQPQQQQRIKQSKSAAGNQKHPRNGNSNTLENHKNLSITSPCNNSNTNSIYGVNSSKCNSLPDYPSHLSNKATPASQMMISDCGEYPQNEESIRQLQEREENSIRQGCSQIVFNQSNNNNAKNRHMVDRYQDHQSEEGIDGNDNSQYGNEANDGQEDNVQQDDSMRDLVEFQVNYQEFLNQADITTKDDNNQQVFQQNHPQNYKNTSYDYWKRQEQQVRQAEIKEQQSQQQLRSHENISYLESKQFSTWKDSNASRTSNNTNHNNSHNSSYSWENNNKNNKMIIDPNEFIEDNLLHNNSSADVNCTE